MRALWKCVRASQLFLGLIAWLFSTLCAAAQAPLPDRPLRQADCLAISAERQPVLMVARARLAAAQSKLASLESLDGPVTRLRHELPIRRQQAQLGIEAAQADLALRKAKIVTSSRVPISRCCTPTPSGRSSTL